MPTDHETPSEKTQRQVHLTSEKVQGNLPQCSHTNESRVKRQVPTEEDISSGHQPVQGKDEAPSRLSGSENAARLALEEQRDRLPFRGKTGSIETRM